MKTRGIVSPSTTQIVVGDFGKRPDPPPELTPRQAEIWREVVASEDAKFFNSGALRALLADYCRFREASEILNVEIMQFKPAWLKQAAKLARYRVLLVMREREVRGATTLATKLRLTNQARYVPQAAGRAAAKVPKTKPWES